MKGTVYVLPFNDEHYEYLQWLHSEIVGMKGEGAVVRIEKIDTMKDAEIIALFSRQRLADYRTVSKALEDLEKRMISIQKGSKTTNIERLPEEFSRIRKDFEEIRKIDFFSSEEGQLLAERITKTEASLKTLPGHKRRKENLQKEITVRNTRDYRGKVWVTRKRPFVDRMASAWLIRKFIDNDAIFDFIDEGDTASLRKDAIPFDIRGGVFTHAADLCTFEVLMRAFGLRGKPLKKIAEIVHDLDMKDRKFKAAEAEGIEELLSGIRKTAGDDMVALEKGMTVFEMLYAAKS